MCAASPTPAEGIGIQGDAWREIEANGVVLGWLALVEWEALRGRLLDHAKRGADVHFEERAPTPLPVTSAPVTSGVRSRPARVLVAARDAALRGELLAHLSLGDVRGVGLDRADRAVSSIVRERPSAVIAEDELVDRPGADLLDTIAARWPEVGRVLVSLSVPAPELAPGSHDLAFGAPLDVRHVARETLALCRREPGHESSG